MARVSLLAKLGLDTKGFQKNMAKAQRSAQGFAKKFGNIMGGLGMKLGAIGLALATKQMANLAVVAEETASKFGAVFKNSLDKMTASMKELKETIPATTQEMQDALSTFGAMSKAFGMNEEEAGDFSIQMVKLAGDLASFHNLDMETAFAKLRSGLIGSTEPLMSLGIISKATEVKLHALELGLISEGEELNALGKAIAVQSLVVQQMGDAHGDAGITANSTANQLKFLRAEIIDNATAIGTQLTPMLGDMIRFLGDVVPFALKAKDAVGEFIGRTIAMGGMSDIRFEASSDLEAMGAFKGLKGRGGEKIRQKLIEERVAEIKKEREELKKIKEEEAKILEQAREADRERIEQAQHEMKMAFTAEEKLAVAKKQLKVETDPRRKKALQDSIDFNTKLIQQLKERGAVFAQGTSGEAEAVDTSEEKLAVQKQELAILKAQASGDGELIKKEKEKLELMKQTLNIMERHNLSREDALALANDLKDAEGRTTSTAESRKKMGIDELSSHDLRKIGNKILKENTGGGAGDFFEVRDAGGGKTMFDRFIDGSKAGSFTEASMRKKIGDEALQDNDERELDVLKEIKDALEGKFKNE
jgi:hypothetical protein